MGDSQQARFELRGPMGKYDARTTPIRGDLADIKLAGRLFAPHYVVPKTYSCCVTTAALRVQPSHEAEAVSELLHGEMFAVLDISGDWAWGYCCHDAYLGYLPLASLGETSAVTYVVSSRSALIFAAADIKSPVMGHMPMGAKLQAEQIEGEEANDNFLQTAGGFVHVRHVQPIGNADTDTVALARRLTGAPYLWGGRSGDGIDCSGLVQMVLGIAGIDTPRDTDQQMAVLGSDIADTDVLQAGDIVFFPGHVGIMTKATDMIHANAHWMQVKEEPLSDIIDRFDDDVERPVLARKRIAQ